MSAESGINNDISIFVFFLSLSMTFYYITRSITRYVQLSKNKKKLKKQFPISLQNIKFETSFLERKKDDIIISTIFLILSIVIAYLLK
ncbi:hypothetical protein [Methanosarcina horonobensis]|uniref:hypothetical protein n=1 Tax=Methanosarcina horonobensis TaxID=418008 RepID=UPI000A40CE06|nr:hypothetical protein [Methanosarcina horonobensis]